MSVLLERMRSRLGFGSSSSSGGSGGRSAQPIAVMTTPTERMLEAIVNDRVATLRELVEAGTLPLDFQFGRTNRSLLHVAASFGALHCLLFLAAQGLDINAQDLAGTTPAHLAARNGNKSCLRALVETLGADVTIADQEGFTILFWMASNGRADLLNYFASMKPGLEVRDNLGQTLLHVACNTGHTAIVSQLLSLGVPVDAVDNAGRTALHLCCKNNQANCAVLLLVAGAKHFEDHSNTLPVQLALRQHHPDCAAALISHRPELLPYLWSCLVDARFEEKETLAVMWRLCTRGGATLTRRAFAALAYQTLICGQELLCYQPAAAVPMTGSAAKDGSFLRSVRCLTSLLRDLQQHPELSQDDALMRALTLQLADLDPIWDTLEQWLTLAEDSQPLNSCGLRQTQLCEALHALSLLATAQGSPKSREFRRLVIKHLALLKLFVESEPTLIFDHFSFVLQTPFFLTSFIDVIHKQPLAQRKSWLYRVLAAPNDEIPLGESSPGSPTTPSSLEDTSRGNVMLVARSALLTSSCQQLAGQVDKWKAGGGFSVQFQGEAAHGDGVKREWLTLLSRSLLNEDYGLFVRTADGGYEPSPNSSVNPDHLNFFNFAGRAVGLALFHHETLPAHFSRNFCKHMVGEALAYSSSNSGLEELECKDPQLARSLRWLLETQMTPDMSDELRFVAPQDELGLSPNAPLLVGGEEMMVTDANKEAYVRLVCQWKLKRVVEPQLQAFLSGLHDFVPPQMLVLFSAEELDMLVSGAHSIDVEDWLQHTELSGLEAEEPVVGWFWDIVRGFDAAERAALLQFATGSPTVPVEGFAGLRGAEGVRPFTLSKTTEGQTALPTSATCFNLLRLPSAESRDDLERRLRTALSFGREGFAFA